MDPRLFETWHSPIVLVSSTQPLLNLADSVTQSRQPRMPQSRSIKRTPVASADTLQHQVIRYINASGKTVLINYTTSIHSENMFETIAKNSPPLLFFAYGQAVEERRPKAEPDLIDLATRRAGSAIWIGNTLGGWRGS